MPRVVYEAVGGYAGRTVRLGHYSLEGGCCAIEASDDQHVMAERALAQYGVHPPHRLEAARAAYAEALAAGDPTPSEVDEGPEAHIERAARRIIAEGVDPRDLYGEGVEVERMVAVIRRLTAAPEQAEDAAPLKRGAKKRG